MRLNENLHFDEENIAKEKNLGEDGEMNLGDCLL